jgi:hypothetical protein
MMHPPVLAAISGVFFDLEVLLSVCMAVPSKIRY